MKFSIISYLISSFLVVACTSHPKDNSNANTDTLATIEKPINNNVKTGDDSYIIEAPDTAYTGEFLDKYTNGNTKFRGFFRFGKRHGQWMAFYGNGSLWSECFYDKGLKHGLNKVYFENGKPRYIGYFKKDMRDSVWLFYDEAGVELKRVMFKNDEQISSN